MSAVDLVSQLQAAQAQQWADAQAAEEAERRKYPDAQWTPLEPAVAHFDPSPSEQQQFADQYRAENLGSDQQIRFGTSRTNPEGLYYTPLADAVGEWRREQAQARWANALRRTMEPKPCEVCGASSLNHTLWVGGKTRPVCRRCQPSVLAAQAAHVAGEKLADGQTRSQAAAELVASTIKKAT